MESPIGCDQEDFGGCERIVGGEFEHAVVHTTFVVTVSQAEDNEMPLEYVLLFGLGIEIAEIFTSRYRHILLLQALLTCHILNGINYKKIFWYFTECQPSVLALALAD